MTDKKSFHPVPEQIPSPEELFHSEKKKEEGTVSVSRRKPIPRYKVIKRISVGFLILLVIIVLVTMNLDKAGISFYYMKSSSMERVIPKGSFLIEYKTGAEELKRGDIITYMNRDGILVTHEIVEIVPEYQGDGFAFWTKGTENKSRDEEIVLHQDVLGRVIFHIPYLGNAYMRVKEGI